VKSNNYIEMMVTIIGFRRFIFNKAFKIEYEIQIFVENIIVVESQLLKMSLLLTSLKNVKIKSQKNWHLLNNNLT